MNTRQGFWHRWRIFLRRVSFDSSKLQQVVWEDASIFKVAELDTEWYAVIDCQAHSNKALGIYPGHDDGCRPTGELVSLNGKDTPCSIYKSCHCNSLLVFVRVTLCSGGIVPFGCLFIEMYFILSAVWSHNKIYYVYGFMFAILVLLCLVIICVSITCTYILLNAEDYRWQWQSYISCAATALYVFLYTIHYFYNSTQMSQAQKFS